MKNWHNRSKSVFSITHVQWSVAYTFCKTWSTVLDSLHFFETSLDISKIWFSYWYPPVLPLPVPQVELLLAPRWDPDVLCDPDDRLCEPDVRCPIDALNVPLADLRVPMDPPGPPSSRSCSLFSRFLFACKYFREHVKMTRARMTIASTTSTIRPLIASRCSFFCCVGWHREHMISTKSKHSMERFAILN